MIVSIVSVHQLKHPEGLDIFSFLLDEDLKKRLREISLSRVLSSYKCYFVVKNSFENE